MDSNDYESDGKKVLFKGEEICTVNTEEWARKIAFSLNYLKGVREEAAERAEFYRQLPE